MTEESDESKTQVIEKTVEEEDEEETTKLKNIQRLKLLIKELNKIEKKGDPNIRICPRCFSTRVRMDDTLGHMGISTGYPSCRCLDCGWKSKKWIYLDRTLSDDERDNFFKQLIKEEKEK